MVRVALEEDGLIGGGQDPELIEMILGKDDPVRMRECVEVIVDETREETERLQTYELLADLAAQIDNANSTYRRSPVTLRETEQGC